MLSIDAASFCSGHRKSAPMLGVSGTMVEPDTNRTPLKAMPGAGFEEWCPGVRLSPARTCTRMRPPARLGVHVFFNGHTGHPDTISNGAAFRCPVGVRYRGEPDTMASLQEINRLRCALWAAVPVLKREGWVEEDLDGLPPALEEAYAAGDDALLGCWGAWLAEVLARRVR